MSDAICSEQEVVDAIAAALDTFYTKLIDKVNGINVKDVLRRKNPYLFRAKSMTSADKIVDAILSAYVSSSEETLFGQVFFEPIAIAACGGQKSGAEGIDIEIRRDGVVYAVAIKSGPNAFNSSSKKRQDDNFRKFNRLVSNQGGEHVVPIIGYSYGNKAGKGNGFYLELAGQAFWEKLTGDPEFYLKLSELMGTVPSTYVESFEEGYDRAKNRMVREFTSEFCLGDGSIDWEYIVKFNSGVRGAPNDS